MKWYLISNNFKFILYLFLKIGNYKENIFSDHRLYKRDSTQKYVGMYKGSKFQSFLMIGGDNSIRKMGYYFTA